ncbi:MAG: hypothetical protein R2710_09400 [Acidimicrobiales bacterium]
MSLRDRFFTKPVAEAIMSPEGIVGIGVGTAVGILAGVPLVGAALIGVGVWGARVAVAIPRGPVKERIDRRTVSGPWQDFVDEALAAKKRFELAVKRTRPGPVHDRLQVLGARIERFVDHSYRVAQSGQQLSEARQLIDHDRIVRELASLQAGAVPPEGSARAQAVAALQSQLATARRLDDTIGSTRAQLLLLDARLDELVTRSIELSVTGGDAESLGSVERDLQDVVDELEAVRLAVEETG